MKFHFSILFIIFQFTLSGQLRILEDIVIEGNRKTKEKVIIRELSIQKGDTLPNILMIDEFITLNEKRLLNLGLFNDVQMEIERITNSDEKVQLNIIVNENWFIYPAPIFQLADRNFNFWWYDQNRDLSRVNYGVKVDHINLTGNNDKLSLTAQWGYTRKLELRYRFPFLDQEGKWAIDINSFYSTVKEVAFQTLNNKTQFGRFNDEVMLSRLRQGVRIAYRPGLFQYHSLSFEYHHNRLHPFAAAELNPNYFLDGAEENRFFYLSYSFSFDDRQFLIYPEAGRFLGFNVWKEGLYVFNDYNNLSTSIQFEQYYNWFRKYLLHFKFKAKMNLFRQQQGFANNSALGWGDDVLRGYELYVVDGSDFVYLNSSFHFKFLDRLYDLSDYIPLESFNKLDVKLYLAAGFDLGYVNERFYKETNTFNNRLIFGYGPSFNFLLYNTYLFRIDYSFNHTGEGGIFLHFDVSF